MTPPRWLFFPTQSTDPQYIYVVATSRTVSKGSASPENRNQDSTGTESGDLADQFAPFDTSAQFQLANSNLIRFKMNNSDTTSDLYGSKTAIGNNITSATLTVGSNTYTAESISIGGQDARPRIDMTTSSNAAQTFWEANGLDDTDNITITVTLTF